MILFVCGYSQAQLEIAPYDFENGATLEGWTIIDNDTNVITNTWAIQDNFSSLLGSDPITVLGLSQLGGPGSPDDWAVLPVQDLSFYSGAHLNLTYLKGLFELDSDAELSLYAFVSEDTPSVADFQTSEPIATIALTGHDQDPYEQVLVVTDIPEEFNVANVHFALVYNWIFDSGTPPGQVIDLTKVSISVDELGINDMNTKATVVKQNPVAETLQFRLGTKVSPAGLHIQVYNLNGILVKEAKYGEDGIPVDQLAAGMYFAILNDGTAVEHLKFIKK